MGNDLSGLYFMVAASIAGVAINISVALTVGFQYYPLLTSSVLGIFVISGFCYNKFYNKNTHD
jgi:ABC-type multidrug transport system permease subunit